MVILTMHDKKTHLLSILTISTGNQLTICKYKLLLLSKFHDFSFAGSNHHFPHEWGGFIKDIYINVVAANASGKKRHLILIEIVGVQADFHVLAIFLLFDLNIRNAKLKNDIGNCI